MATDHRLRHLVLLLLTTTGLTPLASCAGTAESAPKAPNAVATEPATRTCDFGAFVAETDPAGLNVRAAPSPTAKVLGKIPPTFVSPTFNNYGVRVEVEVIGARRGWFLIRNATDNDMLTERPPRPMYAGEGWVSGSKLTVKSQAEVGRAQPDLQAPVVLRIGDNESFDSDLLVEAGRLTDCTGKWAQVEFADQRLRSMDRGSVRVDASARAGLPAGRFRAWVNRICAVQETSCDGLGADGDVAPR